MNLLEEKSETGLSCEFQENLNILREIYFFSTLPMDSLKVLAYLCSREKYKPGDYLFRQGEDDGRAFYIVSGTAKLIHEREDEDLMIRDYSKGDYLGGLVLVGNMRRLFSLKAVTDVNCIVLTRDKFSKAMEQFPDSGPKIFKAVVDGILAWEERFLVDQGKECEKCLQKVGVSLV
jgi:CRP-like cAMP-binding protein